MRAGCQRAAGELPLRRASPRLSRRALCSPSSSGLCGLRRLPTCRRYCDPLRTLAIAATSSLRLCNALDAWMWGGRAFARLLRVIRLDSQEGPPCFAEEIGLLAPAMPSNRRVNKLTKGFLHREGSGSIILHFCSEGANELQCSFISEHVSEVSGHYGIVVSGGQCVHDVGCLSSFDDSILLHGLNNATHVSIIFSERRSSGERGTAANRRAARCTKRHPSPPVGCVSMFAPGGLKPELRTHACLSVLSKASTLRRMMPVAMGMAVCRRLQLRSATVALVARMASVRSAQRR